jgi:hypothetical protein
MADLTFTVADHGAPDLTAACRAAVQHLDPEERLRVLRFVLEGAERDAFPLMVVTGTNLDAQDEERRG